MAIAIFSASQTGNTLTFAVCPDYTAGVCTCPKDANGNPTPPHPTFDFGATSPDARTSTEWAQACAGEAVLLVTEAQASATPTALNSLVGLT